MTVLAGCTEGIGEELPPDLKLPVSERIPKLPVEERTAILEEGITAFEGVEIPDREAFESELDEYGVEIESVEETFDVLTVDYIYTARSEDGVLHDIGPIAGAYAALVEADDEGGDLDITILDPASTAVGAAEIGRDLAERYTAGALTPKEYGELVAGTIESRRSEPTAETELE